MSVFRKFITLCSLPRSYLVTPVIKRCLFENRQLLWVSSIYQFALCVALITTAAAAAATGGWLYVGLWWRQSHFCFVICLYW